jgi:hypothetical protein
MAVDVGERAEALPFRLDLANDAAISVAVER